MATLASYKTLVQSEIDDTSTKTGTVIERAIKDTYQHMLLYVAKYLIAPIEEDVTATASQRYVNPANTYSEFRFVLWKEAGDDNFKTLTPISEEDYYAHYVNTDASSPSRYYIKANRVYFDVAPDNAGTVRISGVEVQDELESATTSVIPDRFTRTLLLGTIARVKAYERLPEATEYFKWYWGPFGSQGRIEGSLGEMIQELASKAPKPRIKLFGR